MEQVVSSNLVPAKILKGRGKGTETEPRKDPSSLAFSKATTSNSPSTKHLLLLHNFLIFLFFPTLQIHWSILQLLFFKEEGGGDVHEMECKKWTEARLCKGVWWCSLVKSNGNCVLILRIFQLDFKYSGYSISLFRWLLFFFPFLHLYLLSYFLCTQTVKQKYITTIK